jgi:hypothetical protein
MPAALHRAVRLRAAATIKRRPRSRRHRRWPPRVSTKAKASIEATEKQSAELSKKIQSQRAELNDVIERRLTLLRQQLSDDEERVRRLPAAKETELRPRLAELGKLLED